MTDREASGDDLARLTPGGVEFCPECGGNPWSTPSGCFCAHNKSKGETHDE